MNITDLRTHKFSVPTDQEIRDPSTGELLCSTSKPWLFLEIETDGGITGWGEVVFIVSCNLRAVRGSLEEIPREYLLTPKITKKTATRANLVAVSNGIQIN